MSLPFVYINAVQVRKALTWPLVCEAVEEAFKAVSHTSEQEEGKQQPIASAASQAYQPQRTLTVCGDGSQILFSMPGYVGNYELGTIDRATEKHKLSSLGCKLVTSFSANAQRRPSLPNILANILLFSTETGQLQCIMDGTDITSWRTAAASIVATKYLYFHRHPKGLAHSIKLAIIGTGVQGEHHALGMCATFSVSDVYLWNRTVSKAEAVAVKLQAAAPQTRVHISPSAAEAVADADVICVATYSPNSLVTLPMLKKPVVHINAVGAGQVHYGEVDREIYVRSSVYVDSVVSSKTELRGLDATIIGEVGTVINNASYPPPQGFTLFQSMGMAAEDVTVAQALYNALEATKDTQT